MILYITANGHKLFECILLLLNYLKQQQQKLCMLCCFGKVWPHNSKYGVVSTFNSFIEKLKKLTYYILLYLIVGSTLINLKDNETDMSFSIFL